jgi:rod shape determining protein RodA
MPSTYKPIRNLGEGDNTPLLTRIMRSFLHVDPPLFVGLLLLSAVGVIVLWSASNASWARVENQVVSLCLAFSVLLFLSQFKPQFFWRWTPWVYGIGIALLVAVLIFGDHSKGAQRWLNLGFVRFQPSEMMKLAVPLMVAWVMSLGSLPPKPWRLMVAGLIVIIPFGLVAKQPDLGTAMLIGSSGFFVIYLAGLSVRLMAFFSVLAPVVVYIGWQFMHDYQRRRVHTFLDPESDPLGAGYHTIQAKIAIGSGGLFGKGWQNGTQSQLDFLPEQDTDFIFAVFSEEFGLSGVLALLGLYLFIVTRGLIIASQAQDTFTRLIAGTLSLTFFVYVFVNAGMVSGLMPVVGVPLPLVSYGGTSMVTLMAGFGIIMSIHAHRKMLKP